MTHEVLTLGNICQALGIKCPSGKENVPITGVATLEEAGAGDLSFLSNPKYASTAEHSKAGAILIPEHTELLQQSSILVPTAQPYLSFAMHLRRLEQLFVAKKGISSQAMIDSSAILGENCTVETGAIIAANVRIGANCHIGSGVVIHEGCQIGNHVKIESGAVIGSEGFGFAPDEKGHYHRIPQLGIVRIHDHVSIGANTTIDRAALGETVLEEGVKIDNLCMIAHNVSIGAHTVMAAQSGIAGSTKVGKHCMIGGQVGIIGHLNIGDGVKIYAQSGVMNDVPSNKTIFGSPALEHKHFLKSFAAFKRQGK